MAASSVTKNRENIKQTISHELKIEKILNRQYLMNYSMDFTKICVILMLSFSSHSGGTKQVRHSIPWNSCFSRHINSDCT